ncbi:MAG: virulence factor MviN [Micrococcales bacterium]|nr:virulence factor MviN [Micrococcales bacterium]
MNDTSQTTARRRRILQGLLGAAAMMAVLTVLSRVLGMVRQMAQASAVGSEAIGTAYTSAFTVSGTLYEIAAGGALAGALIPLLAGPISRRATEETRAIIAGALGWVLLLLVPVGLLLAAAAGPVATALNAGGLVSTTRFFLLVFSVQIPLYGLTVLANAVLQAHHRFFLPMFTPVLSSLVVIGAYLWYAPLAGGERSDPSALSTGALDVLAWGTTAGAAAMCAPGLVALARMGFLPAPRWRFPAGVGSRFRSLMLSGLAGVAAYQVAAIVVLVTANRAETGVSETDIYPVWIWSQQIYILPVGVLVIPLVTSAFPRLSAAVADEARERFATMSALTSRAVVMAAGTGAAVLAAAAPAVALVFAMLDSSSPDVASFMTVALTLSVIALPGHALMYQAQRTLYAMQRARAALVVSVAGWGLVSVLLVVGLVMPRPSGSFIAVLAGAWALGLSVGGVVAGVVVARVAGRPAVAGLARTAAVMVPAAVVGAMGGRWVTDSVVTLLGRDIWPAVGAGVGAALVGVVLVVAVLYLGDRPGVRGLVQLVRDRRHAA